MVLKAKEKTCLLKRYLDIDSKGVCLMNKSKFGGQKANKRISKLILKSTVSKCNEVKTEEMSSVLRVPVERRSEPSTDMRQKSH